MEFLVLPRAEEGVVFYRPCPRGLESQTFRTHNYKHSTFSFSVILKWWPRRERSQLDNPKDHKPERRSNKARPARKITEIPVEKGGKNNIKLKFKIIILNLLQTSFPASLRRSYHFLIGALFCTDKKVRQEGRYDLSLQKWKPIWLLAVVWNSRQGSFIDTSKLIAVLILLKKSRI